MGRRHQIERHDDIEVAQKVPSVPDVRDIDVEQDVVVRLFPQDFHWVEVDAEYLGPARPRIPRELAGVDE